MVLTNDCNLEDKEPKKQPKHSEEEELESLIDENLFKM